MIDFRDNLKDKPYILLRNFYKKALDFNQKNIEAIAISSYNKNDNEVNSRFGAIVRTLVGKSFV